MPKRDAWRKFGYGEMAAPKKKINKGSYNNCINRILILILMAFVYIIFVSVMNEKGSLLRWGCHHKN